MFFCVDIRFSIPYWLAFLICNPNLTSLSIGIQFHPSKILTPKKPTPVTVLGLRLVIWKPQLSDYRVFLDKCPHRLAPLSEGRVDEKTGNLMCSYHGWEFDAQGICTRIPQAENPQIVTKNQKNLCALSLPVRQENDLLCVWLDANSTQLANDTPLANSSIYFSGLSASR